MSDMSETPILFSASMVSAQLVGRKTQTRRVVARSNSTALGYTSKAIWGHLIWDRPHLVRKDPGPDPFGSEGYEYLHVPAWNPLDGNAPKDDDLCYYRVRPRIMVGTQLWVRETWGKNFAASELTTGHRHPENDRVYYAADNNGFTATPWRPSIHMPRAACRLLLEVVSVRVERLQATSEADCITEGIERLDDGRWKHYTNPHYRFSPTPLESFRSLWCSINGEASWAANPWVWVYAFKRLETNQ